LTSRTGFPDSDIPVFPDFPDFPVFPVFPDFPVFPVFPEFPDYPAFPADPVILGFSALSPAKLRFISETAKLLTRKKHSGRRQHSSCDCAPKGFTCYL
jgi:hypothetical protein